MSRVEGSFEPLSVSPRPSWQHSADKPTLNYIDTFYSSTLHCTPLYCPTLHCPTLLYCTSLYYPALHCTALYYPALHCTTLLHCTSLYWTAKDRSVLHDSDERISQIIKQIDEWQHWPNAPFISHIFYMSSASNVPVSHQCCPVSKQWCPGMVWYVQCSPGMLG